jgi:hypothetical protein
MQGKMPHGVFTLIKENKQKKENPDHLFHIKDLDGLDLF